MSVTGPTGLRKEVDALVDTGATYTAMPREMLADLNVEPSTRRRFRLADESLVEYDVGEIRLGFDGEDVPVLAVFGPSGSEPLLGATALENLGFAVDPVNQRLIRVEALLKAAKLSCPSR